MASTESFEIIPHPEQSQPSQDIKGSTTVTTTLATVDDKSNTAEDLFLHIGSWAADVSAIKVKTQLSGDDISSATPKSTATNAKAKDVKHQNCFETVLQGIGDWTLVTMEPTSG